MTLGRHIPPRRLVLAVFLLLGLGLRLWGLDWEAPAMGTGGPEQWGWRVISSLSWSSPAYPGLITQAFFSLAALLQGAVSLVSGGLALLTGQARFVGEWLLDPRVAGRLCAALLGAGQIPLAYLLSRRCFNSVAAGLLAAAAIAVSPLLVTQSHYISLETPLGFLALVTALLAWHAMEEPRKGIMGGLGLVMGLAAATSVLGLLLWPAGLAAALVGGRMVRRPASRRWALWPLCLVGGMILGLGLGAPGLWWPHDIDLTWSLSTLGLFIPGGADWPSLIRQRLIQESHVLMRWEGLEIAVLWLLAVAVLIRKKQWRRLVVALVPVPAALLALSWPGTSGQGWLALWLPGALAIAVWPLVLLCRRLPVYAWQVAAVGVLLAAMALAGMWRSAGVGYLFWQEGTVAAARFWLEKNLRPGTPVLAGPGAPLDVFPGARLWRPGQDADEAYLVLNPAQVSRSNGDGRLEEKVAALQPMQRFDLKSAWSRGPWGLRAAYPVLLNPTLAVYAPTPRGQIREPMALDRPPVGAGRPYGLVYQNGLPYSRDDAVMLAQPGGKAVRVLRRFDGPPPVGLRLRNLGSGLLSADLTQGPWSRRHLTLYPGQQADIPLEVRGWPPVVDGLYPVKLAVGDKGVLWARLLSDPLLLGKLDMEAGRWGRAQEWLNLAVKRHQGFEAMSMLAGALARQNKLKEASLALFHLDYMYPERYIALAHGERNQAWRKGLAELTGYDLELLERATSLDYEVLGALYLGDDRPVSLQGEGFTGSLRHSAKGDGLVLNLWLKTPWPQGQWKAVVKMRGHDPDDPERLLGQAELRAVGPQGSRLVAHEVIANDSLAHGGLEMPFRLGEDGNRLELRLNLAQDAGLSLAGLRVGADIQAHMRRILLWYYDARGLVALGAGQHQKAVDAFQALLDMFPTYRPAYLPLARSLLEIGKLDEATQVTNLAEDAYHSFPDRLTQVSALYKDLRQKDALARVEKRLGHLRPSLKRVSRFEDGMSLLGYDLPKNKVKPGGKLEVNLYWRAWQAVPVDYTIFVHLVGPGGVLNYDHRLDRGRRSMTTLRAGQVVREDLSLNILKSVPPGSYTLTVGLWDPAVASEALTVIKGEDAGRRHLEVSKIEVLAPKANPKK
ncbi:MAG: glycosyltransferase family 39 protein [Deltaproteobacteria bacterium]|nr:glycosyltransferase family 39 protein [Deltaproteobacteria bacterium]